MFEPCSSEGNVQICLRQTVINLNRESEKAYSRHPTTIWLACELYGMISEPGAKTLAWPRGRRGGSAGGNPALPN